MFKVNVRLAQMQKIKQINTKYGLCLKCWRESTDDFYKGFSEKQLLGVGFVEFSNQLLSSEYR